MKKFPNMRNTNPFQRRKIQRKMRMLGSLAGAGREAGILDMLFLMSVLPLHVLFQPTGRLFSHCPSEPKVFSLILSRLTTLELISLLLPLFRPSSVHLKLCGTFHTRC